MLTEYNGVSLAALWGQEAIALAEKILSSALSRPELKQLSTAPDVFFGLLSFAAAFLVISKITTFQNYRTHLPGSSDALLTKIVDRLLEVACSSDHAPAKCARLISALMRGFNALAAGDGAHVHQNSSNHLETSAEGQPQPDPTFATVSAGVDSVESANSGPPFDSNFWISFMDTLTTNVSYEGEI